MAGATPKIIPTAAENPKERITDQGVTTEDKNLLRASDPAIPSSIPIIPPATLKTTASIKN